MSIWLLYKQRKGAVGAIEFDATLKEGHATRSVITDHPVEDGVNITDHVRIDPDRVILSGVISNTPVTLKAAGTSPKRSEENYERLKKLQLDATKVKAITTLREYTDMVIESIDVSRDFETREAIFVDIALKKIVTAKTKKIDLPQREKKGEPLKEKGKLPTKDATPAQNKSWAAEGYDLVSAGFKK